MLLLRNTSGYGSCWPPVECSCLRPNGDWRSNYWLSCGAPQSKSETLHLSRSLKPSRRQGVAQSPSGQPAPVSLQNLATEVPLPLTFAPPQPEGRNRLRHRGLPLDNWQPARPRPGECVPSNSERDASNPQWSPSDRKCDPPNPKPNPSTLRKSYPPCQSVGRSGTNRADGALALGPQSRSWGVDIRPSAPGAPSGPALCSQAPD